MTPNDIKLLFHVRLYHKKTNVYLKLSLSQFQIVLNESQHRFLVDTSRPSRPGEIHGKDYFFDNREQMQLDIEAGKFIEHGEFRGNLYGTSTDGIRDLITAGLQTVIAPHYQVIFRKILISSLFEVLLD